VKRAELEVGLEVALRRPHEGRERAVIVNLEPGWVQDGVRRPWTAYTEPIGGWGMIRDGRLWGGRFELANHRNNNVAIAREVRAKTGLGYQTEHVGWVPDVVPLSQVEQTWEAWQITVAEANARDEERWATKRAREAERKALWAEIEPTILDATGVAPQTVHKLGMDYIDASDLRVTIHSVPAVVIDKLARRVMELETLLTEAQEALTG
jgi:hypothetical protein